MYGERTTFPKLTSKNVVNDNAYRYNCDRNYPKLKECVAKYAT